MGHTQLPPHKRARMGASLGCCAAEALCCAGGSAISCCGRALQCNGAIGYPMIVFACTVICLLFRYVLLDDIGTLTKHLGSTSMCANVVDADAKAACYANQFVYRIGFAMTLFFAAMMLLVGCFKRHVHDGAWCLKVGVLFAIFFASLWINDDSMAGFASATLYGSAVFIVINVLVLLEWVYAWNESWVALAQEDESYFSKLLLSAVLPYVIAIIFIVLCCVQFAASGCDFAIAEVTWTSIGCVLFSVLSISGIAEHGSLLCSGIVTLYCCFYCWSALSGMASDIVDDTGARCNTLLGEDGSAATTVNVIFGLLLTCCSLAYAAYATSTADLGTNTEHTAHKDDAEAGGSVPYESIQHAWRTLAPDPAWSGSRRSRNGSLWRSTPGPSSLRRYSSTAAASSGASTSPKPPTTTQLSVRILVYRCSVGPAPTSKCYHRVIAVVVVAVLFGPFWAPTTCRAGVTWWASNTVRTPLVLLVLVLSRTNGAGCARNFGPKRRKQRRSGRAKPRVHVKK